MTMTLHRANNERVLYVDWEVQEFRSVGQFSEYRKIKARLQQGVTLPEGRKPRRPTWLSDHRLNIIIAASGVLVFLVTMVSILITLQVI